MVKMSIMRRIDHLGRIVLPIEFRMKTGAVCGDVFEITQQEDGVIILTMLPKAPECKLCSSKDNLVKTEKGNLCKRCLGEFLRAAVNAECRDSRS